MNEVIYELALISDGDEPNYWTLGLWKTVEEIVDLCVNATDRAISAEFGSDEVGEEKLQIRERPIGICSYADEKIVADIHRSELFEDDEETLSWRTNVVRH